MIDACSFLFAQYLHTQICYTGLLLKTNKNRISITIFNYSQVRRKILSAIEFH